MTDNNIPSKTTVEKIGEYHPDGTPRQVILNNVPMELIDPFYTVGISNADWKAECVSAMNLWSQTFNDIFPKLNVNFVAAPNSIDNGNELENDVAPGATYDLEGGHEKGLGDIRFGMHGPLAELAHAAFPVTGPLNEVGGFAGDVHFDPTDPWRKDADPYDGASYSIGRVALHELGHSFGLPHQMQLADGSPAAGNLMWPIVEPSYTMVMDDDTKNLIRLIYTHGTPYYQFGWQRVWFIWDKIREKVQLAHPELYGGNPADGTTQTVTIWYSFMHQGTPALVDRITGCCTCCGTQQANMRAANDGNWRDRSWPNGEGHGCYCGCCACKPNGNLHFKLLQCETILPRVGANDEVIRNECSTMTGIVEDDPGTEIGQAMEFTLSRWELDGSPHSGCYNTQAMYNKEGKYTPGYGETNVMGCRAVDDREARHQIASGFQYTDRDQAAMYEESWGFSGTVCEGHTVPNRPAYTFGGDDGGQCLGMSISASLCCCKTGTDNDYLKPMCYPQDCEGIAYPTNCWPSRYRAPKWDCNAGYADDPYSDGDLVRKDEVTYENWKEFRTNPVYKWVAKDTRNEADRCNQGFKTTIEDNGATKVIWTGLHMSYFAGHDCPPELRDDFYKAVCPLNSTIQDINDIPSWQDLQPQCLKEGFNWDGTRNPDGGEGWSYTDPNGVRKTLSNLPYPNNPLECSIDCFSFNIRPNHEHYKYEYLKPVKADDIAGPAYNDTCDAAAIADGLGKGEVPYPRPSSSPHIRYAMTTGTVYSACSPCTYKQGLCDTPDNHRVIFDPTEPLPGTLGFERGGELPGFPEGLIDVELRKGTDSLGFCNIVSGQCKDNDPKNPKFFKLLVAGAWMIHCDCQTGVLNVSKHGGDWAKGANLSPSHGSSCYQRHQNAPYATATISAPEHEIDRGDDKSVDCISESSCECLGSPSTYQNYIAADGSTIRSDHLYANRTYVELKNTKYPCSPSNALTPPVGELICRSLSDGTQLCWYKSCWQDCVATYRSEPPIDWVPQGVECTNVSWSTMDWNMNGVPGQIARYQAYPAKIAGDCGDPKCWFNYKTCPPYTDGGSCGSDDIASSPWQQDPLGHHGALSCGCNSGVKTINGGTCASFCEKADPVYMFWTGVIEELDPYNEMQPTACQYGQLHKRFEDGTAYTSSI